MKSIKIVHALASLTLALAATSALAASTKPAERSSSESTSQQIGDERREAQIWTTYAVNPHLKAHKLDIEVDNGTATLSGKVDSGAAKDLAEQIALGVDGIKKVNNNITVDANYEPPHRDGTERTFGDKVDDATVTATVKSKLLWNSHTDGLDIHVETVGGKVTLTGSANSGTEKDLAGRLARNTSGVSGVDNKIAVGAPGTADKAKAKTETAKAKTENAAEKTEVAVSDSWITTKVKSTLLFSSDVSGTEITVATDKGIVKLSGEVDSQGERQRAVELAQNVTGVKKVDASAIKIR
jgi:osmotically-inducible protein OsmY